MDEQEEILKEFLVECSEGLGRLDREFVALEKEPANAALLGSIFRTIHTIKGTCGFLGLPKLENTAHGAENVLSQMRDGKMPVTPERVTILLEAVDAIKEILSQIESSGKEPEKNYGAVRGKLDALLAQDPSSATIAPPAQDGTLNVKAAEAIPATPLPPAQAAAEAASGGPSPSTEPIELSPTKGASLAESSIRVDVGLLDKLMNLVSELVLVRNQFLRRIREREDATDAGIAQRMNLITTELQDSVMKTRMQPIRNVWEKLPRVVRDLALMSGKEVELVMEGAETELDKTLLEAIKDPLTHIVRNAVDHGIEAPDVRKGKGKGSKGTLSLKAYHEGGQILIEVSDDGGGIDTDKVKRKAIEKGLLTADIVNRFSERESLNLIFLPGLSTAEKVTHISGRGVGMDVVRTNIEKIGGSVELTSRLGQGTNMRIKIPLTLAVIPALMVIGGLERFAIPQASLVELVLVDPEGGERIETIHGAEFYRLRGNLLPLLRLDKTLGLTPTSGDERQDGTLHVRDETLHVKDAPSALEGGAAGGETHIVVLNTGGRLFGLVVDEVSDSEEIVVKPLGRQLKDLSVFAGATIMGDGRVALILDVDGIAKRGGVHQMLEENIGFKEKEGEEKRFDAEHQTLLIFSVSGQDRFAVPLSLVSRLEEFDPKKIDQAAGGEVIQYRGGLLPLIRLHQALDVEPLKEEKGPLPAIVFTEGDKSVGLLVGRILDVVDERVLLHPSTVGKIGISGSAVIDEKTTDLMDVYQIIEKMSPGWFKNREREESSGPHRILLVEDSIFFRGILRPTLEAAGYRVTEASDGIEALRFLRDHSVDLILSDIEMPRMDGFVLAKQIKSQPKYAGLPLVALTSLASEEDRARGREAGFQEHLVKFEREKLLSTIHRILAAQTVGG